MYFVCTDIAEPIAHASLESALKALRSELRAREKQGYTVAFTDELEFRLARPEGNGRSDGHLRMWIEDDAGQNVASKDSAEAG